MSGDSLNIDNSYIKTGGKQRSGIDLKISELRMLFGEFFPATVKGSDIGKRMKSGQNAKHYSPMEIVNGLKSAFANSTVSVVESDTFQEFLNSIDETNVQEVYQMFSQTSLTSLIADDVMSSVDTRKESIIKLYDAFSLRSGNSDNLHRQKFMAELDSQFKKMGFMVKCENLDNMIQDMIQS